jgi:hypothetical protein
MKYLLNSVKLLVIVVFVSTSIAGVAFAHNQDSEGGNTSSPSCPFDAKSGRTIVKFTPPTQWVLSDGTEAQSKLAPVSVNLPAGDYKVSLASYDSYEGRQADTQPQESWFAILKNGNTEVARTAAIGDLQDKVKTATRSELVNTSLTLSSAVTSIVAQNAAYPSKKSANSVAPICAAFDKLAPTPPPPPPPTLGSIKVCKIVVDGDGKVVDGSDFAGAQFSVAGIDFAGNDAAPKAKAVLSTTNFTAPLTLNADLLGNDHVNDAQCVTYDHLKMGSYYYAEETISGDGWNTPKYNDQNSTPVTSLSTFYNYSGQLFTPNPSDDAARDMNADGHITLTTDRPHRTLVVLNTHKKVVPNQKPTITLLGENPMEVIQGTTFTDPGATASDPEDGDITSHIVASSTVDTNTLGSYTVRYNVSDSKGLNADEVVRAVHVVEDGRTQCSNEKDDDGDNLIDAQDPACHTDGDADNPDSYDANDNDENSKPVITLVGDNPLTVTVGQTFTDPGATANDLEDGDISDDIVAAGTVDTNTIGDYTRTYNVTDSKGAHADQVTRTVTVVGGTGGNTENPECSDNIDNDEDTKIDALDPACHTDGDADNPDSYDETLDDENSIPVITLVGDAAITLTQGDTFTDPGATAFDEEDGNITEDIVVGGDTVSTSTPGTYTITYDVTDSAGAAAAQKTRTVTVNPGGTGGSTENPECADGNDNDGDTLIDQDDPACHTDGDADNPDSYDPAGDDENSKPVITLLGDNPMGVLVGGTFTDPGATAFDEEDGDITNHIIASSTVATSTEGTYTVTYNVTDSKGKAADEVSRTVNVQAQNGGTNGGGGGGNGGGGGTNGGGGNTGGNGPIAGGGGLPTVTITNTSTPSTGGEGGTIEPEQPAACVQYLRAYIKLGEDNDRNEVIKLQAFLRTFEGFTNLVVDGVYKQADFDAVSQFQLRYYGDVLAPWGYAQGDSTGYVYYTTRKKINEIYCQRAFPLTADQVTEVAAFRAFLESLRALGVPTEGLGGEIGTGTGTTSTSTNSGIGNGSSTSSTTAPAVNSIASKISQQFARAVDALSDLSAKQIGAGVAVLVLLIAGVVYLTRRPKGAVTNNETPKK